MYARIASLHRRRRRRSGLPLAALVGYTNAGKSTLINALTQMQKCLPLINSSPHWIRLRAACNCRIAVKCCSPIRSDSSKSCRRR